MMPLRAFQDDEDGRRAVDVGRSHATAYDTAKQRVLFDTLLAKHKMMLREQKCKKILMA